MILLDESGFYLLPGVVKTYAPRGQTPVLRPLAGRQHLSMMGAVSLEGDFYTLVRDHALHAWEVIVFLEHLSREAALRTGGRLLVVWDRSPIHRAAQVRSFLAADLNGNIVTEGLPPYAPDLNPVEGIWQYLKHVALANLCCYDLEDLRYELRLAIRRLRKSPTLIQSFFAPTGLSL